MIVLDTNVVSELMRPVPDEGVVRWVAGHAVPSLFVTSITHAEVLYGIEILPAGRRRAGLEAGAARMFGDLFAGRILSFTAEAAALYAAIAAGRRAAGVPIEPVDALIAAVARTFGATLATRNVADFEGCGIEVVNPWDA